MAVSRTEEALLLRLYIQPKASRDQIVGLHGDELKVAITAPPVDGQANAHLTKFLAKQFRVAKGNVCIEKASSDGTNMCASSTRSKSPRLCKPC